MKTSHHRGFQTGDFFQNGISFLPMCKRQLTLRIIKVDFSRIFYQLENRKLGNTFTLENSVILPNFKLNVWGFYSNSMNIFTTSSAKLKTLWQVKINPIVNFTTPARTALIKLGGTFYIDEKMDSLNKSTITYKWSGGASVKKKAFSSTLTATGTKTQYALSESISFYTRLTMSVLSSYTLYLNDDGSKVEKHRIKNAINAHIFSIGDFSLNAKESLELTFKDGATSGTNTLSLYAKQS